MRPYYFLILFLQISVTAANDKHSFLKPVLLNDEFYSETFTIFADLNDGSYVYAQVGVSNIGPGDQKGLCRIMIFHPLKKTVNHSVIVDRSKWFYQAKPNPTLKVGTCELSLTKNQQLRFSGQLNQSQLQIQLQTNTEQKKHLPFSQIASDNSRYLSDIIIPWGKAQAWDNNLSSEKRQINGYGYADHSISTFLPADLARRWIRFRGINQAKSHLLLVRYADDDFHPQAWLWRQNNKPEIIHQVQQNNMQKLPAIDVQSISGEYKIKAVNLIYRHAPLEENGFLAKVLSKLIGNPVTYTYRATLSSSTHQNITGILEVTFADE